MRIVRSLRHVNLTRLLILCLLPLVAASCSREEAPAPTGATAQEAPARPGPSSAATAEPEGIGTSTLIPGGRRPTMPSGSVVMVAAEVGPVIGDPATGPYRSPIRGDYGIGDYLFKDDDGNPMAPMLASSWEISPEGGLATITLRENVPFNTPPVTPDLDYGELTAEDVAWMLNRHNATTNDKSTAGDAGLLASFFGEVRAVSRYTLEIPLAQPAFFGLPLSEMKILRAGPAVESKKAFELLGPEKVREIAIGTGPFVQKEWIPGERGVVEALPTHWLKTSNIETFTIIQVLQASSRLAMMEAGQADIAQIDLSMLSDAESKGLIFVPTMGANDTETVSVVWAGNLWEERHAKTGEPLEPWNSSAYEKDRPWIGNPWGDSAPYIDVDNPPGMSDMEQARLVRWALSMAIDREDVVSRVQNGQGTPIYTEYMGPLYPGWDDLRTVDKASIDNVLATHDCTGCPTYRVSSPVEQREWPWQILFDPQGAEQLLDLAGYPRGSNGTRFEIKLNKYACETGEVCLAQADAVAAGWEAIGVGTILLREDYLPLINGRMRMREQFWPVVKNCIVETAHTPLDWPLPPHDTSLTRPGWGCGFESPFLAKMHTKITTERSRINREDYHLDVVDWMFYWQLYNGITQQPKGVVVNPTRIKSWSARSSMIPRWHRPEFIKLAGQ